jgi:glycerate 2-kinase
MDALQSINAETALRETVNFNDGSHLKICDEIYDLSELSIYAVAVGKAAYAMATAIDKILDDKLQAGIISGVLPSELGANNNFQHQNLSTKWKIFSGGHPLPNEASIAAAESCFELLRRADDKNSLIIFLISGGGSAMLEAPRDAAISLENLRETNFKLITSGASIAEINKVRKALSRVKNGGLSALAPNAKQATLIVSDTERGDELSVASAPSLRGAEIKFEEVTSIIKRHNLSLPPSVLHAFEKKNFETHFLPKQNFPHYVLLDNQSAIRAAATSAESLGYAVEVADDISQQEVASGCEKLLERLINLRSKTEKSKTVCLISGGEFACRVRGSGIGGRNSETVLRMAKLVDKCQNKFSKVAFLSAGTDGIDGNSVAAGAVCDETTIKRAKKLGLNAQQFLENSDSYNFFKSLGDDVTIGATGTNVRDLRIFLAD